MRFAIGLFFCCALGTALDAHAAETVNDITQLNPIVVDQVARPTTLEQIAQLVANHPGPIAIGGGRYSMGGQTATEHALQIDMRGFNRVLDFSKERKEITVQPGITWRALQDVIDPQDLSVSIMQSYANFTVGGALSVNAHGRYVGAGPVINSVRAVQLVLADGSLVEACRRHNTELFHAAIGGYGALGVITEVELDLVPNTRLERAVQRVPIADYPAFFSQQVRSNPRAVLHNADLAPPYYDQATCVTWSTSDKPLTVDQRLVAPGQSYALDKSLMWSVARLPGGPLLRKDVVDPLRYLSHPVVWRNYAASADVASLGPIAYRNSTYALQEYFVPVAELNAFIPKMAAILQAYDVDAVNISIRHAPAEPDSHLSWAREEVFSLVLYYWQHVGRADREKVGTWTRALIDAALALGGTYYLPYQVHATPQQFSRAYPNAQRLFALKAQLDPQRRWRNALWDTYYR